jgi:UDPglucose 6-dehydrogenase
MKVAVIGAGRVGIVTGLVLFEQGHELTLFDVDASRVAALGAGEMPFFEPGAAAVLRTATRSGRWTATDRADDVADCEAVLIAVPTPAGPDGHYDLGPLREAISILSRVRAGAAGGTRWRGVFLRSTVLPGTTERILRDGLADAAHGAPPCPVGYLPEFLREGSALADAREPDRIVVGAGDPDLYSLARALFEGLPTTFFETGIGTAELVKTANNALLSTCISFANEIARIAETTGGADARDVFAAIHLDRRFRGPSVAAIADYLLPGPGFGGSCLGKDLAALAAFARSQRLEPLLLDAALRINQTQPVWFVDRIDRALGGLAGRRVLVLGLAFKPGTDDSRESISLPILRELASRGAAVQAHDPRATGSTDPAELASLGVAVLADDAFHGAFDAAEAVVLVTAWPFYVETLPLELARRSAPLLFADARGILRDVERAPCVDYLTVGGSAAPE